MKRPTILCIFFLLFPLTSFAKSKLQLNNDTLIKILNKYSLKTSELSLVIEKEEGGRILSINENQLMIPASVTKVATALAVLNTLPLDTVWTTELQGNGKVENGILKGDLCFKGGGDPGFVSESMWVLVQEFMRQQIHTIEGNIIYDRTRFDSEEVDKNREAGRVDRAYDAPISALSFNWNAATIFVKPSKVGERPIVFTPPQSDYLMLDNKAITSPAQTKLTLDVSREQRGERDVILVRGQIPENLSEKVFYKSITNPGLWTATHLAQFLKKENVIVKGKIIVGSCAKEYSFKTLMPSKKLSEQIADMLKFSNNFVAEMLVKNLAAVKNPNVPAEMEKGLAEIHQFLLSIGIKNQEFKIVNASGLSRENKLSSNVIIKLLNYAKDHGEFFPEFIQGLPIAGVDGTLKKRLAGEHRGVVRAKTGYLDGISSLAGYIQSKKGEQYVFSFIYNGSYENALVAKNLYDELSKAVLNL